jgi:type II secretion system protein E
VLADPLSPAVADGAVPELLTRMMAERQLTASDARSFLAQNSSTEELTEERVLRWLAQEYGVGYAALDELEPDKEVLSLFPARLLLRDELLPLRRIDNQIEIATSRLFFPQGLDGLRALTGLRLRPVLAPAEVVQRELKKRLGVGADTIDTLDEASGLQVMDENGPSENNLDNAAEDASIIRFVNQVLKDAIELRASDIHLEPFENELRIRYRIDGVLQEVPVPAQLTRFQLAIGARVKILSHLNIAEKRLPQDGRIKVKIDDNEVDIRVSVIPMLHGEAVVMRLLRQNKKLVGAKDLGMNAREYGCLQRVLELPHGIVLVTGPTGSGKTSTLYTALHEINDSERKIITIEDPVEYQMRGVNQIQVNEKSGLTFARGLRSILRHDPDVILIGEIRDAETAQIAVQASLTGHLVFSTLHTNDAAGAITRLVDMGVEPYLVASSLEAVLAQRLVRLLCPHCKVVDDTPMAQTYRKRVGIPDSATLYRAVGCRECRNTGYHGRRAIFEWMDSSSEIRQLILQSGSTDKIRDAAVRAGMTTLADDGRRLVEAGVTTIEEVLSVTTVHEAAPERPAPKKTDEKESSA